MVRLRKLLDQGSEVTFLPGDGAADDGSRTYVVRAAAADGTTLTATGPSPQSALLNVTRLQGGGRQVTYAPSARGGWFADLRENDGQTVATGLGRSHAEALADLREQLGQGSAAADDLEPYCSACGAAIGIFQGHGDAWKHYRGSGTAASPVELLDTDHELVVARRTAQAGR